MWIEGRALYRRIESDVTRPVVIALDLRGLTVKSLGGEEIARWPFGSLVRHPEKQALIISPKGSVERVEIAEPPTRAAFEAALKTIPTAGEPSIPRRIWAFIVGAAVILILLVWGAVAGLAALSETIAPLIPGNVVELIDRQGKTAVLEAIGSGEDQRCTGIAGDLALARLGRRLSAAGGAPDLELSIGVYRASVANALALPAGSIVVTDALLALAETDSDFAAVLAHEIAHVALEHGMRKVVYEGGVMLVAGLVTGDGSGAVAGATQALLGAAYSRDAERVADAFAVDAVAAAGGDPARLAAILDRISEGGEGGGALSLLDTHPLTEERSADILDRAASAAVGDGPLMPADDWAAIRRICEAP